MKIYIENQNEELLDNDKFINTLKSLDKYFNNFKIINEVYSDEGIFITDENNVNKLVIKDEDISKINNYYKNINLLIDKSEINSIKVNQIPFDHFSIVVIKFYYQLNNKSKINFVVEGNYKLKKNKVYEIMYNELEKNIKNINKYDHFVCSNFYFEVSKDSDINNIFFKEDINVFLSHFN